MYMCVYIIFMSCIVTHKCYIALAQSFDNAMDGVLLLLLLLSTRTAQTNARMYALYTTHIIVYYSRNFTVELLLYFNSQKFSKGVAFNKYRVKQ